MAITAKDVKKLRGMTGAGMMDCKRALIDAGGSFEAAIDLLRKKGQKIAAKRAEKEASQGLVVTRISADGRTGIMVEVNCETDFVARNDEFSTFAETVAEQLLRSAPVDLAALLALKDGGGRSMAQTLTELTGKIGEKMAIRRFAVLKSETGRIVAYVHPGARLGVLVELSGNGRTRRIGRDVAMQVAALDPVAAFRSQVPQAVQEKEMDIAREAARNEGKPEHILHTIAKGKLERYFKDHVLVEQPFIKDSSVRVRDMLKQSGVTLHRFVRYQLGA